ncbi:MAG: Crp/Fnr family transcriptional regulator [Rhodospirillaceae bacterium]
MTEKRIMDRKVVASETVLFREGQEGDFAYLVQNGTVEIYKVIADGSERRLGLITEGGIFGEMALIDDQPRMANARTVEACTLVVINRMMFEERLHKVDPFIRGLLNMLVRNLRDTSKQET